jgi:hypothetical protein
LVVIHAEIDDEATTLPMTHETKQPMMHEKRHSTKTATEDNGVDHHEVEPSPPIDIDTEDIV